MSARKHKVSFGKKLLIGISGVVGIFLLVVLCYGIYLFASYKRIADMQVLEITEPAVGEISMDALHPGQTYGICSYNVGFGAYTPDYSFFMDGGKYARSYSAESASSAILGAAALVQKENPDFVIFQEVDRKATRSHGVNEEALISGVFPDYYESFAVNYDSAYLFYPFHEPIGKSYSGIALYSRYPITESVRRSLPISESLSKFLDLDRCYSVSKIPVDNGRSLCIYSVHLSAYGNSDAIREAQTSMLFGDMQSELEAGNYVICGGDFNHDLKAEEGDTENRQGWAYPFPRSEMPEGLQFAMDLLSREDYDALPDSNRNDDTEYIPGQTYTCILDGFIISDNVKLVSYDIISTGFLYSDHEPVFMDFVLN